MELPEPDLTAAASLQVQEQLYHVSTQQTRHLTLLRNVLNTTWRWYCWHFHAIVLVATNQEAGTKVRFPIVDGELHCVA
jgi:hypothetical protein